MRDRELTNDQTFGLWPEFGLKLYIFVVKSCSYFHPKLKCDFRMY